MNVKPADMDLGDVIQLYDGPYGTATITHVEQARVKAFRPYGSHSDASYGPGPYVIEYTGHEDVWLQRDATHAYVLWRKGSVR